MRNNEGYVRSGGNEIGAGGDKRQGGASSVNLPDSTTKSPKNQRAKRQSRSFNKTTFKTPAMSLNDHNFTATTNQANNSSPTPVTAVTSS